MPTPEETFAQLAGGLDYPMLVVTTVAEDRPAGCLVGFATQCSIDPPRFLVCISEKNHTLRVASRAPALAVHVVPDTGMSLARLFGGETGDELDKFSHCHWHPGPEGLPIIDECGRWFAGRVIDVRPLGDHVGFLLEPFAGCNEDTAEPLSFQQTRQLEPGHEA